MVDKFGGWKFISHHTIGLAHITDKASTKSFKTQSVRKARPIVKFIWSRVVLELDMTILYERPHKVVIHLPIQSDANFNQTGICIYTTIVYARNHCIHGWFIFLDWLMVDLTVNDGIEWDLTVAPYTRFILYLNTLHNHLGEIPIQQMREPCDEFIIS